MALTCLGVTAQASESFLPTSTRLRESGAMRKADGSRRQQGGASRQSGTPQPTGLSPIMKNSRRRSQREPTQPRKPPHLEVMDLYVNAFQKVRPLPRVWNPPGVQQKAQVLSGRDADLAERRVQELHWASPISGVGQALGRALSARSVEPGPKPYAPLNFQTLHW